MPTEPRLSRRAFLASLGVAGAAAAAGGSLLWARRLPEPIPGRMHGASAALGHRLRENPPPAPSTSEDIETVIVGGGIAGLSAAWWLARAGYRHFRLLELEHEAGGNARSGANSVSPFPWAAHYVPLPTEESRYVRLLFEELGVIRGYERGRPAYNEYYLCADPHERLLFEGRWQDGLVPHAGLGPEAKRDLDAFFAHVKKLRHARGRDGRPAFAIPLDLSSADPAYRELDRISMAEYLKRQGWKAQVLLWYVDYCCRDDYGAGSGQVSAWAGLHYFASRAGEAANAESDTVLTWPEGNGWIVSRLRERVKGQLREGALTFAISPAPGGRLHVDSFEPSTGRSFRLRARHVIFAAPRFVAGRVIAELAARRPAYLERLQYSPWMVANVTVSAPPAGRGAPLSWDNVSYYSRSLGYVVATHQSLRSRPGPTVLTYFQPLDHLEPAAARREALAAPHARWAQQVASELERMHPGIRSTIRSIDVMVWGHGMITPRPGFLWGSDRAAMARKLGRIRFAHSDMSGISIFEEAQYRGVEAARDVLRELGERAG